MIPHLRKNRLLLSLVACAAPTYLHGAAPEKTPPAGPARALHVAAPDPPAQALQEEFFLQDAPLERLSATGTDRGDQTVPVVEVRSRALSLCLQHHFGDSLDDGLRSTNSSLARRASGFLSTPAMQELQSGPAVLGALALPGALPEVRSRALSGDNALVVKLYKHATLRYHVRSVTPARYGGFAALRFDGSVVTWGEQEDGGDSSAVSEELEAGSVTRIIASHRAFAAVKSGGEVVTWGNEDYGGDSSAVQELLKDVQSITATAGAFAALKADGSVVTWGTRKLHRMDLGEDSSAVHAQLRTGVRTIFATDSAFAAIKSDGSVVTWGNQSAGGDSSAVQGQLLAGAAVSTISATDGAFAAIKSDGSVVTWGRHPNPSINIGGDSSAVAHELTPHNVGVQSISATTGAFAAIKSVRRFFGMTGGGGGSVVTWGDQQDGGDSSAVRAQLQSGVQSITAAYHAFAAIKSDGSVVTWGNRFYAGDSSDVRQDLRGGVKTVTANVRAFAALKEDGSVVTWGVPVCGGDSSLVTQHLKSGVRSIIATGNAFAALKEDGSVVTWGNLSGGGDSSAVQEELRTGVQSITATYSAFAALKSDGSVVSWGELQRGRTFGDVPSPVHYRGGVFY